MVPLKKAVVEGYAEERFVGAPVPASAAENWWRVYGSTPSQLYPSGTELFQQGSIAGDVFVLEKGLVKLTRLNRAGAELIVGLRFARSLLGIAPVILHKPYPVTATTLTGCLLRRLSAAAFLSLARSDPEFSWHLQEVHCREVYEQITQMVGLACLSARHRLEQFLRQLIAAQCEHSSHGEIRMHMPLKHREIAQLIAVTPQHLSLVLRQMEVEGTIRREKGWVIVRNYQRLYQPSDSQEWAEASDRNEMNVDERRGSSR